MSLISISNLEDTLIYCLKKNISGIVQLSGIDQIGYLEIANTLCKIKKLPEKYVRPVNIPKKFKINFTKYSTLKNSLFIAKATKINRANLAIKKIIKNYV